MRRVTATADVLIVGAGPAGSFLGYLLARAGFDVAIIDRATFPRDKVCGGGLSNKVVELLPFDISAIVQRRVTGAFLTYQNRDTVVKDMGERSGIAVLRSEFDHFLVQKAIAAGSRFQGDTAFLKIEKTAEGLVVSTGRGLFRARYVVAADGVFSAVRRCVFGRDLVSYAPAVEALVSVTPDRAARIGNRVVFDFGGMPRGYGWIFPKSDHLNVGVFSIYPTKSIRADLSRFMTRYELLDRPVRVRYLGFAIPLKNRRRKFERDNVLLLGDAAGFAESFYGEGIYFALRSAQVAAEALSLAFDRPTDRAYSHLVESQIQPELTYSAMNARMFFRAQKFAFYRMVRNEYINDQYAELIAGRIGHRDCFYKTILTSPYWLFSRRLSPLPASL